MSAQTVTAIGSFGEEVSSSALFVAEIDEAMHTDADGNVQSEFAPNEPVYFLLHHGPEVVVVGLKQTGQGGIQFVGPVSRIKSQRITFEHSQHSVELSYYPAAQPAAAWFGETSGLVLADRSLVAAGAPCIGDISYPISAVQYMYRSPTGFSLAAGEKFPVAVVVDWKEA